MAIAPIIVLKASLDITDTFFLMVLALLVFGPRRLPEIGRQIGRLMHEFRKASNDFKFQMDEELRQAEQAERLKKLEAEHEARKLTLAQEQAELKALTEGTPATATTHAETADAENFVAETETTDLDSNAPKPEPKLPPSPLPPVPEYVAAVEREEAAKAEVAAPMASQQIQPSLNPPSTGEQVTAPYPGSAQRAAAAVERAKAVEEATASPEATNG